MRKKYKEFIVKKVTSEEFFSFKPFMPLIVCLFLTSAACAEATFGQGAPIQSKPRIHAAVVRVHLTAPEIEHVKAFKKLIRDVDGKSLMQTIAEIETAANPQLELQMQEAIAKTYADIVLEEKVGDLKQKEWLYSMVTINMAYLQFGAKQDDSGNALNRMIRKKLREYLPPEVLSSPEFLRKLN